MIIPIPIHFINEFMITNVPIRLEGDALKWLSITILICLFFRFEMLEFGEYPSFEEVGDLLKKGFNFELYEEGTIIPEMYGYSSF